MTPSMHRVVAEVPPGPPGRRRGGLFGLLSVASVLSIVTACGGGDDPGRAARPARAATASGTASRGVVLITVDGLVASETSAFGGPLDTPQLARMVEGGRAWTAWTASPLTRPAAASYLTGRMPQEHGVWNNVYTSLASGSATLATALASRGYRTAAFPDSSHVGYPSGLLADFEVVDEPPPAPTSVVRWLPAIKDPAEQGDHFAAWIGTLGANERFFAWLHASGPFLRRFGPLGQEPAVGLAPFDALIGRVLGAVGDETTVIVAGTFGQAAGADGALPGPGLDVSEGAIAVPVIVRGPDVSDWRAAASVVAATDVSATIAELCELDDFVGASPGTGVAVPLSRDAPGGRVIFTWSRAPRDQFGWLPIGAARQGDATVRTGAGTAGAATGDAAAAAGLDQVLARHAPPPPGFAAIDQVTALLRRSGLEPRPVPAAGRPVQDAATRRAVATAVWNARVALFRRDWQEASRQLETALRADPDALTPLLDRGQLLQAFGQVPAGHRLIVHATEAYPGDVEAVHWYAHAIWNDRRDIAAPLLAAILPERPQDPDLLYDMACARTLDGDLESGERMLRDAIQAGYRDWEHMESDADLRALRESGRFAALMREYRR